MINDILNLLKTSDFYGVSEEVEIAKGKYKKPETFKEGFYKIKRLVKWRLRK